MLDSGGSNPPRADNIYQMTIAETCEKCKKYFIELKTVPQDVILVIILLLACLLSFGLGYLAGKETEQGSQVSIEPSPFVASTTGQVVASKNGTKYYLPWCAGADRISDANKVWFPSPNAAKSNGYSPASNCNGL